MSIAERKPHPIGIGWVGLNHKLTIVLRSHFPAFFTTCFTLFDVLPRRSESPPYTAVTLVPPTGSVEVVKPAEPPLNDPVPNTVLPCSNVMVSPSGGRNDHRGKGHRLSISGRIRRRRERSRGRCTHAAHFERNAISVQSALCGRAIEVACAVQNQAAIRVSAVLAVESPENRVFVAGVAKGR